MATVNVALLLGLGVAYVLFGSVDDTFTGTIGVNFIVTLIDVKLNDLEMFVRVVDKLLSRVEFRLRAGTAGCDPFKGALLGAEVTFETRETVTF